MSDIKLTSFPMQPVKFGRFVGNRIVDDLLTFASQHGYDMNHIARLDYEDVERMQFAQLIGYSISGYSELSYVTDESYNQAELLSKGE